MAEAATADIPSDDGATPAAPAAPATNNAPAAAPAAPAAPAANDDDKGAPPSGAAKPDDWATRREAYANGDAKLSKRLARFSSEKDAIDALIAAQNKISSGELKAPLPKDATPEQLAAWREENGVPAEPSGYDLADLKLPEGEKPILDSFLGLAHSKNLPPEVVKDIVKWNNENTELLNQARQEEDARMKVGAVAELKEAWGSEYQLNNNLVMGLLDGAPASTKGGLLGGRLADGTPIMSSPDTLRWLATLAREVNPTATIVPGSGTNTEQALESELAKYQKMSADRSKTSEYWHGPMAEKNQARFRELLDVQSKMKR